MPETLPRWGMPDVNFIETDPEKIKSDIINRYETATGRTLSAGDPVRLFLLTIASEIIQLRQVFNHGAQQNLLTYAQGQYLDALGVFLDTARQPADKAVTTIQFTLTQALSSAFFIPAGFQVSAGNVIFETTELVTIAPGDQLGTAQAECTQAGPIGNGYLSGQISTIVAPLAFLASAVNTTESIGGSDIESDASYAERLRLKPNSFSVAGPEKAYIFHAFSASPSIIDVAIDSPTPGVVNVYTLLTGGALPSTAFLQEVEDYLSGEEIRPLTDEVHAKAPTASSYSVNVDYYVLQSDAVRLSAIQTAVQAAVNDYVSWQQAKIGRDINPDELIKRVRDAGAGRILHSTLTPAFKTLTKSQVAQCSSVTVTFKGLEDG